MESLYIVDVSNLFYRAFWGLDPLTTPDGRPTQALHGFLTMLNGIVRDKKPTYVALALESKGPNWRKQIYPAYKGNRTEPNPDLTYQLNQMPALLEALNYPTFQADGYEADDVIGSLAVQGERLGLEVYIVSSDKDFSQLVSGNIRIYDHMKGLILGEQEVFAKYGVRPDQFKDYLSIVGDTSDNIKGVAGVGPKGAMTLIQQYDNLDNIIKNIDKLKPAMKKKFQESLQDLVTASELVKIEINRVPIHLTKDALAPRGYQTERLKAFLNNFGLRHHLVNMLGESATINTVDGMDIGKRV
jgi:DNA polymerase-1